MKFIDHGAFGRVVDRGSVAASAAPQLTQSKVTRRVHNLEVALGTRLLDRQIRALRPTQRHMSSRDRAVGDLKLAMMHDGGPRGDFRGDV
jgi:DNA-binding transcriptional LysR family regulator